MSEEKTEYVLISLCLLGVPCRYHGKKYQMGHRIGRPALISKLEAEYRLLPLCPEQLGGLPTPRPAARVNGRRVETAEGEITEAYERGTEIVLELVERFGIKQAWLLKDSPACGRGYGVTAKWLAAKGILIHPV
jgi:uncharacterized protein YbbK (DUF523 family)